VTVRLHKKAIIARLREDAAMVDKVFDGIVPSRTEKYAVVHTNTGRYPVDRFTGPQGGTVTYSYWLHSVGSTPEQAQAVAECVLRQLIGWRPTVTGYRCSRMVHRASQPTQLDGDGRPPVYYCVDQFDLTTNPT
jgi:hypothetical protein